MITVVGSINLDTVALVDRFPRAGETLIARSTFQVHGGKGGNQAVAAARLGAEVRFVGCVGSDAIGDQLVEGLRSEGIDTRDVAIVPGSSGVAMITIDGEGENAIVVGPGANGEVVVTPDNESAIRDASTLLAQLEVPLSTVEAAMGLAGGTTILNAAPASRLSDSLLANLDVLIVNETELHHLTGSTDPATARSLGVPTVVTTLGERGAQVVTAADIGYVRAPAVTVQDTTGAGDAFCGAFAVAIEEGRDVFEAAARGVVAGSLATTRMGARSALPSSSAIDRLMLGR